MGMELGSNSDAMFSWNSWLGNSGSRLTRCGYQECTLCVFHLTEIGYESNFMVYNAELTQCSSKGKMEKDSGRVIGTGHGRKSVQIQNSWLKIAEDFFDGILPFWNPHTVRKRSLMCSINRQISQLFLEFLWYIIQSNLITSPNFPDRNCFFSIRYCIWKKY